MDNQNPTPPQEAQPSATPPPPPQPEQKKPFKIALWKKIIIVLSAPIFVMGLLNIFLPTEQQTPTTASLSPTLIPTLIPSPTSTSAEGKMCGGIAAFPCPTGYMCKLDGDYPDAGGKCVKNSIK